MAYKCKICNANEVEHSDDICELCAIGQDPLIFAMQGGGYADKAAGLDSFQPQNQNAETCSPGRGAHRKILLGGGVSVTSTDPYGNSIVSQNEDDVQVYQPGQVPDSQVGGKIPAVHSIGSETDRKTGVVGGNAPLTSGITKNITTDTQKKSFFEKLFRTLFSGVPYSLDGNITMFQVFPDYSGTALNAQGNTCDQVIVYGKLNNGTVSENNDVEVYGKRDVNNNIIAKKIRNIATGTNIEPEGVVSPGIVWGIVLAVIFAVAFLVKGISGSFGAAATGFSNSISNLKAFIFTSFVTATVIWTVIMFFAGKRLRGKSKWYLYVALFILMLIVRI